MTGVIVSDQRECSPRLVTNTQAANVRANVRSGLGKMSGADYELLTRCQAFAGAVFRNRTHYECIFSYLNIYYVKRGVPLPLVIQIIEQKYSDEFYCIQSTLAPHLRLSRHHPLFRFNDHGCTG